MYKQLDLGTVDPLTLEPRVSVLDLDRSVKLASDIKEYILELRPSPGKTLLHVIALGAYEFYGPNRNKDSFAEYHNGPGAKLSLPDVAIHPDYSGLLEQFKGLGVHDGRKVFETFNDANAFEHHKNKDPNKRIGDVLKSFYNNDMHRVELIISLDHSRCPSKFIDKINSGDMLAFSMGCHIKFDVCMPKGTLIRTENGHKPIEEITIGTPVLTHLGRYRPVSKLFERDVAQVVTIGATGSTPLKLTENHPLWVVRKESLRSCHGSIHGKKRRHTPDLDGHCSTCNNAVSIEPEWIPAEDIRVGDYLMLPVGERGENVKDDIPISLLAGLYIGDGHLNMVGRGVKRLGEKYARGVVMTSHSEQLAHIDNIKCAFEAAGCRNPPRFYPYKDKKATAIVVSDRALAARLMQICGAGSRGKYLSKEIFDWPAEAKLKLLGGYIDTDGCVDPSGATRVVSVNRGLMLDLQRLLASIGIASSCGLNNNRTTGYADTVSWRVHIGGSYLDILRPYSLKARNCPAAQCIGGSPLVVLRDYLLKPVTAVSINAEQTTVYNLAVLEDESYVAEGTVVHNCSTCGNKAPTRAQYCEHAKNMHLPGHEFASDGTPISVFNPNAKFFDISIVFRPADRIGYQLKKIANDAPIFSADVGADVAVYNQVKDAAGKLADMDKRVRGFVKDVRHIPAKLEVAVKSLPKYLPDELDLDKLSSAPFGDLINTAHTEGIVFGAAEIAGILANKWHGGVKNAHVRKLAEYVPLALSLIQQSPETVCEIVDTGIFSGRYSAKLAEDLGPIKASRGCDREDLLKQAFLGGHKAWHGLDDIGIPHPQEGVTTPVIVGDEQSNLDAVNLAAKDSKIKTLIKALTAGLLVGGAYRLFTGSGGLGAGLLGASGVGLHDLLSKNPVIPFGDYQKSDVGVIPTETLLFKKGEEFKIVRASEIDANLAHNKCAQAELLLEDASFGVIVQRLSTILEGDFLGVSD